MKKSDLAFFRPDNLIATVPPEARGVPRDGVRLLVSTPSGHTDACFSDLPAFLQRGDLLVVNRSATLAAALPAVGPSGSFVLHLSTRYDNDLWLAEPRWSGGQPGPLPLAAGDWITVGGARARMVAPFPGIPRLWFVVFPDADADADRAMARAGQPIRYGYVHQQWPLEAYQTLFATAPGSAEMPSAARPFTLATVTALEARGVSLAAITLHTGVSSLEVEADEVESQAMYPEPYRVPAATATAVNAARAEGRRVIAVGTTVVRALESAWDGHEVRPASGFTRIYVHPARGVHAVDGMLTGLHDPLTSHLAMLYALAGRDLVMAGYDEVIRLGYLWHEFGDSHLILP